MKLDSVRTTEILILKCGQTQDKLDLNDLLHNVFYLVFASTDYLTYNSICLLIIRQFNINRITKQMT